MRWLEPPSVDGLSVRELGPPLKASRLRSTLARHTPPNRVHCRNRMVPCITDWQFASSCSPRSDFAAAVSFRYRPVDSGLIGTLTLLRGRLHSRTPSSLRDGFTFATLPDTGVSGLCRAPFQGPSGCPRRILSHTRLCFIGFFSRALCYTVEP